MKRSAPSIRTFVIECSIVLVGAVGWQLPASATGSA